MPTIKLKTLDLQGRVVSTGPSYMNTPNRPNKKRRFTEDEWRKLNSCTNEDLFLRIERGRSLIEFLHSPQMINMSQGEAARVASNLHYQIDAIREILRKRGVDI